MAKLLVVLLVLCAAFGSFADVTITSVISERAISTSSATLITVVGSGFTGTPTVKVSGVACTSVVVHNGGEIECLAQPGLGQGNEVSVTESGNTNTARVLNFASATVTLCGGSSSETVDLFATSSSKAVVSICGANFGEAADTTSNTDWTGRLDVLADRFNGDITLHEDNLIVVEFSTGSGKYNAVKVLFGSQLLVVPGVTITFPPPAVTHVEERPLNTRSTLTRLAIFGKNFGNPAQTIVAVNIGNFKCNINVQHVSDSLIVCSVSNGFGANVPVEVVVNGYSSLDVLQFAGQAPTTPVGAVAIVRYDFTNAVVPGYGCVPPAGAVDVINTDYCNCWSGYAPLLAQPGTECSVKATCPGRVASAISANYFAPSRPTYKFEQDTFVIVQTQPIVANRRDTVIEFVTPNIPDRSPATAPGTAGSPTCMYPGVLWEKKVNELDCLDEFHGRMPWSQNEFCGWVEDTAAENIDNHVQKFKTNLVSTYTETYKAADGSLRFRKMSNSYLLTVSFTRQITAFTTSNVNVYINDPDSSLTVAVRDDAFYDVASHQVIINFETTIAWPYQLDDITLTGAWTKAPGSTEANTPTASAVLGVQGGDLECTTSQDTDCSQSWVLTISGDACDLHGSLAFNTGTLICRDLEDNAAPCLFTADTDFTIQLGKTDLCDDAAKTVDATEGLTHSMESFYDAAHTIPQNTFQTGDKVFFQVKLNDPISSIDAITFNGITLASSDDEDVLYQVQTIGDLPTDVDTVVMSVAEVNVTSEIRQPHSVISPGSEAILTFEFRLLRNHLQSLAALTQTYEFTVSLTLTATVDIWYHGNQKRTVTVGATSSTAHASISYFNTEVESQLEETHNNATPEADGWESEVSFFNGASITGVASVVAVLSTVAAVLLA